MIEIVSPIISNVGQLDISNSIIALILLTGAIILSTLVFSRFELSLATPSKFQLTIELLYGFVYDFVIELAGKKIGKDIVNFVITLGIFVLIGNVMTLAPIVNAIQVNGFAALRTPTSDISIVLGLGVITILATHFYAIKVNGVFAQVSKYFPLFTKEKVSLFERFINQFVALLDVIGELAKVISLSLRLFGNIFAGEVMATLIILLAGVILPVPIQLYAIFSGTIQAYIFMALTASYFGSVADS